VKRYAKTKRYWWKDLKRGVLLGDTDVLEADITIYVKETKWEAVDWFDLA